MSDELKPESISETTSVDIAPEATVAPEEVKTEVAIEPEIVPEVAKPVEPEPVQVDAFKPIISGTENKETTIEPFLAVDVSFNSEQIGAIADAGLEPAQVRNEIGLVKIGKEITVNPGERSITLAEAIRRAKIKYQK